MSGADIRDAILERVGGRAEAEVTVATGVQELTRFANSAIHQNVGERLGHVTLRVAAGDRVATADSTNLSDAGLAALVEHALSMAAVAPIDPEWPGFTPPSEPTAAGAFDPAVAAASPDQRADLVAAFVEAGPGMRAAGYCETVATQVTYGNTSGHRLDGEWTRATIDGIHQTNESAGSGHAASHRLGDLDAAAAGAAAAGKAQAGVDATDIKAGDYEVVLEPNAVGTIAMFLAVYGFNGKMVADGQSFVVPGSRQVDPAISLVDDPTDPRAIGAPFDIEGTPKPRLDLIRDGYSRSIVHTRRTAHRAGTTSNGRALAGWMGAFFGAVATNLFVPPGTDHLDDMIGRVERGLLVTEFNYCRVLDPRTLVVTGLTRNGTFMIENGAITHPVTNLRFTQSFVAGLADGAVLGVESEARFANSEYGAGFTHVPSLHLARWRFSGNADG